MGGVWTGLRPLCDVTDAPMLKKTLKPSKMYLAVRLNYSESKRFDVDLRIFKTIALSSVRSTFGDVGILGEIDAIEMIPNQSPTAVFRVDYRFSSPI